MKKVVRLLLGHEDVVTDSTDHKGRILLSWATENGIEEEVKLLLSGEDLAADFEDQRG
jgi:hypothetical protein